MKKWIGMLLILTLVLAACDTGGTATEAATDAATDAVTEEINETEDTSDSTQNSAEVGEITHLGYGTEVSLTGSKEGTEEAGPSAQASATLGAVAFDAEGRIVDVQIDVIQPSITYTTEGTFDSDQQAVISSKRDLGDDYGMIAASGIGKEWYEQIDALQNWMVGKTVEEITGLNRDEDTDLNSSVTISVDPYQRLVQEAWDNKVDAQGATKVGIAIDASAQRSAELQNDVIQAQFDIPMAAVAVDDAGVVKASFIDNAQVRQQFAADGSFAAEPEADAKTKNELGADYNMIGASGIGKEWNEQAQAIADWAVGKDLAGIEGLSVTDGKTDDPDLSSSVTITVTEYQAVLAEAIQNAE